MQRAVDEEGIYLWVSSMLYWARWYPAFQVHESREHWLPPWDVLVSSFLEKNEPNEPASRNDVAYLVRVQIIISYGTGPNMSRHDRRGVTDSVPPALRCHTTHHIDEHIEPRRGWRLRTSLLKIPVDHRHPFHWRHSHTQARPRTHIISRKPIQEQIQTTKQKQ